MARKPRQRQRLFRWLMYAIAIVVVVLAILLGDWERIGFNFFNLEVMADMFPEVLTIAQGKSYPPDRVRFVHTTRDRELA